MLRKTKSTGETLPFIILLGSLGAFDPLSIDMYLPSFPSIGRDLSVNTPSVELSLTAFFIGLALGQSLYGPLSDHYGRRKPLLVGMTVYLISSVGCAFSTTIQMLIVFRVLQALGGCSGMVITRAIVRDLFEKQRAAHIFSILMLVMGIAPILAPLIGGYLVTYLGWRSIFGLLGALSLISVICSFLYLPETHHPSQEPQDTLSIIASLKTYLDLFRDREFLSYALTGGAVQAGMFAYIAGSPFVLMTLWGVSPERYGWIFGANAVGIITASQINRVLLRKFTLEMILLVVVCCSAIFAVALFASARLGHNLIAVIVPLFLFVTTIGFVFPNSAAGALAHQGHRAGAASSLLGTLQWSVACFSSFLVSYFHNGTSVPMTGVILASGIMGMLISARQIGRNRATEPTSGIR